MLTADEVVSCGHLFSLPNFSDSLCWSLGFLCALHSAHCLALLSTESHTQRSTAFVLWRRLSGSSLGGCCPGGFMPIPGISCHFGLSLPHSCKCPFPLLSAGFYFSSVLYYSGVQLE